MLMLFSTAILYWTSSTFTTLFIIDFSETAATTTKETMSRSVFPCLLEFHILTFPRTCHKSVVTFEKRSLSTTRPPRIYSTPNTPYPSAAGFQTPTTTNYST